MATDVTRRVLIVQHQDSCPPGYVAEWLTDAGLAYDVLRPDTGQPLPDAVEHDALVVLGGSAGANDDATVPYLSDLKKLMARTVERGFPTLGICLGHQLLATACGGRVDRNPAGQTAGLRATVPRPAAAADQLYGAVPADAIAIQWNNDIVTELPPDAELLSASVTGDPLAFRVGERAWGVQFHPEADAEIVAAWADKDVAKGSMTRAYADDRIAEIAAARAQLVETWRPWAQRFAEVVRGTHCPE